MVYIRCVHASGLSSHISISYLIESNQTVCVVNRMAFDADYHTSSNQSVQLKQLFISRSRRIKDLVQRLVEEVTVVGNESHLDRSFLSYERVIHKCNAALTEFGFPSKVHAMDESKFHCDFSEFKEFFLSIKKKDTKTKTLAALVVWTQIR